MALSSSSATAWISASAAAPTTAVSIRLRTTTRWKGRMRDWAPRTTSSSETGSGQCRPARAPQRTARVWARRACWAAAWSALSRPSSSAGSSWVRSISSSRACWSCAMTRIRRATLRKARWVEALSSCSCWTAASSVPRRASSAFSCSRRRAISCCCRSARLRWVAETAR
ncbi:hypothetical protein ACFQ0M_26800 [Kitasatospora aburaviensis]